MRFVFVMDVLDRVDPDKDTTFGFIESAQARGHDCYHCLVHQIERRAGAPGASEVSGWLRRLRLQSGMLALVGPPERHDLAGFEAVFVRKDPPFDSAYAHATLLLEGLRGRTLVVNDPRGLREANEKLYALEFPAHVPPTLVSADRAAIGAFVDEVGGDAVIKPVDGAGGFGVLRLRGGDANARAIIDLLTHEGRRLVVVQQFIDAVSAGDKRVLLLDGEPLGAILRVPTGGDFRANIHVGGHVLAAEITARERAIVADLGPRLRADGLVFVGLDLIGERLTEINVTSPTGIRELSRFAGERVSDRVIGWVETHALRHAGA